jgi:hypothetical protein
MGRSGKNIRNAVARMLAPESADISGVPGAGVPGLNESRRRERRVASTNVSGEYAG